MHIHRHPYRYINAHTNTHTHTHHIHVNIHTYTLYTCIHIQWNELLIHLCDEDIIHRHTSLENLNEHIFSFLKTHPNQTTIHMTLTAPSKKTPSYYHVYYQLNYHSYLLSYKLLVQRIFQIVWYHLWCRLPEVFAIRYIAEPTYSHSIQFYFLDYRYLYDLLQASKYIYTKFSPAFGLSKYVIFMNGYYLPTIK